MSAPPATLERHDDQTRPVDRPDADAAALLDIAVLDDCSLVFHGVRSMLGPVVRCVRSVRQDTRVLLPPAHVTLWDPAPGGRLRSGALPRLLADPRHGRVMMHSLQPPWELTRQMLDLGCAGFVDKSACADELLHAVLTVARGGRQTTGSLDVELPGVAGPTRSRPGMVHGLSRREAEVVSLIAQGLTNVDISQRLYLTANTVKSYIRSAYHKLKITTRAQAVRWGIENGLVLPVRPFEGSSREVAPPV